MSPQPQWLASGYYSLDTLKRLVVKIETQPEFVPGDLVRPKTPLAMWPDQPYLVLGGILGDLLEQRYGPVAEGYIRMTNGRTTWKRRKTDVELVRVELAR